MQVTSKGQVTIPKHIRDTLGIGPHNQVEFIEEKGRFYLCKVSQPVTGRGKTLIQAMRGKADIKMSTDTIMALTRGEE